MYRQEEVETQNILNDSSNNNFIIAEGTLISSKSPSFNDLSESLILQSNKYKNFKDINIITMNAFKQEKNRIYQKNYRE